MTARGQATAEHGVEKSGLRRVTVPCPWTVWISRHHAPNNCRAERMALVTRLVAKVNR